LLAYVQHWFSAEFDRDGDGIPEWEHVLQTGFEDNPAFTSWHPWSQGADITLVESPALCAMLYNECRTLIKMAQELNRREPVPALEAWADNLKVAVEAFWDSRAATYRYWDCATHQSPKGEILGQHTGPGVLFIDRILDPPARILMQVTMVGEVSRRAEAYLHGEIPGGQHRVEHVRRENYQWSSNRATHSSEMVYAHLERVEMVGLGENDEVTVRQVDLSYQDQTLLLPVWAGIPTPQRVERLATHTLASRYHRPYGLPAYPNPATPDESPYAERVWLPWNLMTAEGLLVYGRVEEARDIFEKVMAAVVANLKSEGAFRRYYHAQTGLGMGERNAAGGLPPLSLFLDLLGVRILSPWRVALQGRNPFPWAVTLKYRGLMVGRGLEETVVTFPDRQSVTVRDLQACVVDAQAMAGSQ
jgi:hypothetical protein